MKVKIKDPDWVETQKRFIGFFDIMGFKNMVLHEPHNSIKNKLEKLTTLIKSYDDMRFPKYNEYAKTVTFSDSILIITSDNSNNSAAIILAISSILMSFSFEFNIPIKGCISHGEFTANFNDSIYFGKPLIEAYELEEQIKLYSIVLTHSFESKIIREKWGETPFLAFLLKYKTPLKGGAVYHYHVNWIFFFMVEKDYDKIKEWSINFYDTVSGLTRIYVDNTMSFINELIEYDKKIVFKKE